ncbi:MAG: hypothetical protein KC546_16175, partial [Anaerolineae bacterium]|nr:hypothetical protein [Anaerolineae bacterium]
SMRKLALLLVIVLLVMAGAVQARDKATLTDLARYYGDDTLVYVGLRTDAGFADELMSLYERVRAFFPDVFPEATSTDLLDMFAQEMAGTSFEEGFGSWLGDTAAVGMTLDTEFLTEARGEVPPIVLTVQITDHDGAVAFVDAQLDRDSSGELVGYSVVERDGFTVYLPDEAFDKATVAIGSDVMMISPSVSLMQLGEIESGLDSSAAFADTIAMLPENAYNVIAYMDSGEINRSSYYSAMFGMNFAAAMDSGASVEEAVGDANEDMPGALMSMLQVETTQAFGFTVLDGWALTVDIASRIGNTDVYEEMGISIQPIAPLDTTFTSRIPADAILVAQGSDFGPTTQMGLDSLRQFGAFVDENGGLLEMMAFPREYMDQEELLMLESFSFSSMIGAINTGFSGLTGLNLERDVLPVLNGDFAAFVRVLPAEGSAMIPVLPDFGMYFQTDNDEGAAMIVESLHEASLAYGTDYSIESLGEDGAALNLPVLVDQLGMGSMPALDLLFGAGNGVFSFGTRPAVEASMGVETSLTDTAAYQAAQAYFLPDSSALFYIDLAPLSVQLKNLMDDGFVPDDEAMQQVLTAFDLLESASGTVTSSDGASSLARFTLSLAPMPGQ